MKFIQKKLIMGILCMFILAAVLTGCDTAVNQNDGDATAPDQTADTQEQAGADLAAAEAQSETAETTVTDPQAADSQPLAAAAKEVIIYFANWNEYTKGPNGEVASIPWEQITYINHAFWAVVPAGGAAESSFERRDNGDEPRTEFTIVSTDPEADYLNEDPSAVDSALPKNHFAQYEHFSQIYPDVNIMISLGGWTRSGYFSEMAYTEAGRQSFIDSCMALMEQYAWIDGIDIDWEYPAGNMDGERAPENAADEGCPIWGTAAEDNANFTLMLQGLRRALEATYGPGVKKLTACASASYGYTLPCQDWVSAEPYLDYINIMTYDFTGVWAGVTGHNSGITDTKGAVGYLTARKIPSQKLNIGSPLYGMDLQIVEINPEVIIGSPIETVRPSTIELDQTALRGFTGEAVSGYTVREEDGKIVKDADFTNEGTGWHFAYAQAAEAPYLYNDDETSEYYRWYISYEDALSLQAKLDLIFDLDLGGMIVWECGQDTAAREMITQMGTQLIPE